MKTSDVICFGKTPYPDPNPYYPYPTPDPYYPYPVPDPSPYPIDW